MPGFFERAVILGVDGAGRFFAQADTPNIDAMFADGAVSYDVLTSIPTISAECWGSMLIGVTPERHRLTNSAVSIPRDTMSPYPSIFRVLREAYPDAALASFCNWNPINIGIIEDDIGVYKDTAGDEELTERVVNYLADNDPKLLFVHFDEVDAVGHRRGYGAPEYLEEITRSDALIGRIYEAYSASGRLDGTLFIVAADHGGTPERGHGGVTDAEKYVFFGCAGRGIAKGRVGDMEVRDIPAIVARALGVEQPASWSARVPSGVFEGVEAGERPAGYTPPVTDIVPPPARDGADSPEKLFADGRVVGASPGVHRLGADEKYLNLRWGKLGVDSFSAAFVLDARDAAQDISVPIFGDKSLAPEDKKECGFCLYYRSGSLIFTVGNGTDGFDYELPLPDSMLGKRTHCILAVHRGRLNRLSLTCDFELCGVRSMDASLREGVTFDALELNFGADGTGHTQDAGLFVNDFILLRGSVSPQELHALMGYYLD